MKKELSSAIDYLSESNANHAVGESDIREAVEIPRGLFYQHLDLKMYLTNSIIKTAEKILEIQMTEYNDIPTDKYEIGRLEAYQEILKYLTK